MKTLLYKEAFARLFRQQKEILPGFVKVSESLSLSGGKIPSND